MSTKPIREALERLKDAVDLCAPSEEVDDCDDAYAAALEAVRAIEEMARVIIDSGRLDTAPMRKEKNLLESIAKEAP